MVEVCTGVNQPNAETVVRKAGQTFNDILPSHYITATLSDIVSQSLTSALSEKFVQAVIPKVQGAVEFVRRTHNDQAVCARTRDDAQRVSHG